METVLAAITPSRIVGVLLFLASIWLIRIILHKERRNFFQATMLFLFFLLVLLFLNQSEAGKLNVLQLRERYFPPKMPPVNFRVQTTSTPLETTTEYYLFEPYPPISLTMDSTGDYFHITDPGSANRILRALSLPEVQEGAQELVSITGSPFHKSLYLWEDYPGGYLIMERTLFQDRVSLNAYQCIIKVTVTSKKVYSP